ncbi:MAG: response regulator transcription factor [Psychromonas sp.]
MKSNNTEIVLVVDDSPESLGMLNVALNAQGYTALVALSGLQALAIAEKVEPDVVLLDAMMPGMDGFETCRRLKENLPNTPIVFMTGLTDVEDVVKGFAAGGVDYVTKPISPDEVIARIKTHIQTAKLALSAQNALDHAGKNVFCVGEQGRLSWATPHVHQLIAEISESNKAPWATLSKLIKQWIESDTSQNLKVTCFSENVELVYERQQAQMHLLRFVQSKLKKQAEDLKVNLPITKRESEVLYWISYGKTSWETSQILTMSPRTVNKHLEQIYKKLGVDNRTSAAAISLRILEA